MTSPMSPAERAAALARCEAATEGPWTVGDHVRIVTMAPGYFWSAQHIPHGSGPQQVPDAAFIAHARTDLPRALAELDKADARIAELLAALRQGAEWFDEYAAEHRVKAATEILPNRPTMAKALRNESRAAHLRLVIDNAEAKAEGKP